MDRFPAQAPTDAAGAVLRSQAALLSRADLRESAAALAVEIGLLLACDRVSVGLLSGSALKVVATSQGDQPDARLPAATAISAAMREALDQAATVGFPPVAGAAGSTAISLNHQLLAGAGRAACTVPFKGTSGPGTSAGREGLAGAITLERMGQAFTPEEIALCEDVAGFAGPVLELKQSAALPWWRRVQQRSAYRMSQSRFRWAVGGAVVALMALTFIPMPYTVSAPARLEGSVQRAIVASADGFLQQANVRAGDRVKEGQVLAELASQDLQLERRRRQSEYEQHESALRTAQARNDRSQMVVSQSRAAEAQAMLALVDSQIARSRITAPFDGIVIKGDLSQTLGAPVQRGEVLLTLAPNDSFRLIVEVDESDIASVQPGQRGALALAAVPDRALAFTTKRIVPVATTAQTRNYFEVEAALDSPGASLRPGLSGVARIATGDRSLGWQLTHRFVNWLRLAFWSVGL